MFIFCQINCLLKREEESFTEISIQLSLECFLFYCLKMTQEKSLVLWKTGCPLEICGFVKQVFIVLLKNTVFKNVHSKYYRLQVLETEF